MGWGVVGWVLELDQHQLNEQYVYFIFASKMDDKILENLAKLASKFF